MSDKIKIPTVFEIKDASSGLKGWLAVDSLINNCCSGGLRIRQGISVQEMADLARAMTLKFGYLSLPHGGAKAGIFCDDEAPREHKLLLLKKFLEKAKSVLGEVVYEPYPDIGTDRDLICTALQMLGKAIPKRALVTENGGWYTSLTVIASAKAVAKYKNLDLSKATVAVEGFGRVGSCVAENLYKLGSKVVAISTSKGVLYSGRGLDIPKLLELRQSLGSRIVEHRQDPAAQRLEAGALVGLNVDALFPCAAGNSIDIGNVSSIKAGLISPGANLPLTKEAETFLFKKRVLCIPHFIANCGGILGGTLEFSGFRPQEIERNIMTLFSQQVSDLINDTFMAGSEPLPTAEEIALRRFELIKVKAEEKSFCNDVFTLGLGLYRNGLLPRWLVRNLAAKYFRQRILGIF
jgi:glutamate dehydrogenase (NAD(P)+)